MPVEKPKAASKLERKEKTRKRYSNIDLSKIRVIPAKTAKGLYDKDSTLRVGIYARVSTPNENQTSSYELQKNYYEDMVKRNPNWELVDIYADEGISGTSLNHRDEFMRLMDDCMEDKIDLVVTKSVSRFARNVEDCVHFIRQLTNKKNKTGVLFEAESIYSLDEKVEMALAMVATMAQEESHIKSVNANRSIEMRYSMGLFLIPVLLGYDHNEDGKLVINKEEAKTVRLIFLMYLCDHSTQQIADEMTRLKRSTKIGNLIWSSGSIAGILQNERHCGDILARKTYTPNYLDHKSVKNDNNDRTQYYKEDDHEAIVSREIFRMVQLKMEQARYGFRTGTPELQVISKGVLKGFVQINPCWMGFDEQDYVNACESVMTDGDYLNPVIRLTFQKGDYDFRSYQVTREQFVPTTRKISVNMTEKWTRFSCDAVAELPGASYVELLVHPLLQMVVVRQSTKKDKHAVKWAEMVDNKRRPRRVRGIGFMPILYDLFGWDTKYRYTLTGFTKEQDGQKVLVFFADEPEIRMYENRKMTVGYPKEWADSFGERYLVQAAREQAMFTPGEAWSLDVKGQVVNDPMLPEIKTEEIREEMEKLRKELEEEAMKGENDGEDEFTGGAAGLYSESGDDTADL